MTHYAEQAITRWARVAASVKETVDATIAPDLVPVMAGIVLAEIDRDMRVGIFPSDVPDFSTLHAYVDANMYLVIAGEIVGFDPFDTAGEVPQSGLDVLNAVTDYVSAALESNNKEQA